ncbi:hypothetical protein [Streptomyces sp. NPDC047043]|uniref:hypothetical protein n=1 Tax=Streptomyces sp. NPDC047043 TaxID=3154497 RepID=UPI0033DE28B6
MFAGELEVPKQALTRILHRITADDVEYVFDDSIAALTQHDAGVRVEFERGAAREFGLVLGADGLYSKVRQLAFGPHADALRHLGLSGTGFTTANFLGLDHTGLLQQGKGTAVYAFSAAGKERMAVGLSFETDSPALDRLGREEQEQAVRDAFAGHGWEMAPRLPAAMSAADDFHFSSSAQVRLGTWSHGRIALVGDAATAPRPPAAWAPRRP